MVSFLRFRAQNQNPRLFAKSAKRWGTQFLGDSNGGEPRFVVEILCENHFQWRTPTRPLCLSKSRNALGVSRSSLPASLFIRWLEMRFESIFDTRSFTTVSAPSLDCAKLISGDSKDTIRFLCFLADTDIPPLFVPYADFEEIFREAHTASDGQYKVQLLSGHDGLELYVARCGRFNVEAYAGFETIDRAVSTGKTKPPVSLSHAGVQTLLAAVGNLKGYDVWVPAQDVCRLEWSLAKPFKLRQSIPQGYSLVESILSEIDVVWVTKSRDAIQALFEVEHTTTIYSGLLRFNDILLSNPRLSRFSIVSNESRRSLFSKQLFRPTFQRSGLAEVTSFLEYSNVYDWHSRLSGARDAPLIGAADINAPLS